MRLREPVVRQFGDGTHPLETSLEVLGGLFSIDSLRAELINSPYEYYKKICNLSPRFSEHYGWEDDGKFVEAFGDDVNPPQHGQYQARTIAIPMILAQRQHDNRAYKLTPTQEQTVVAHEVQHDDAEYLYGDISFVKKTKKDAVKEFNELIKMDSNIFGAENTRIHINRVKQFDNPRAKINDTFERIFWSATERLGYFATALAAWDISENYENLTRAERANSKRMAVDVGGRHLGFLQGVRGQIIYVDDSLTKMSGQISEVRRAGGF